MSHQKIPRFLPPGARRPWAAKLQPKVRQAGLRKERKPGR